MNYGSKDSFFFLPLDFRIVEGEVMGLKSFSCV